MLTVKESIMQLGMTAIGCGAIALSLIPECAPAAKSIMWAGSVGVTTYLATWSKFDTVFKNLKLGKESAYPFKKRKEKKDGFTLYEFTLPAGLSTEDIEKHKEAIQQHVGKEIEVSYGFKNFYIKEYTEAMKTHYDFEPMMFKSPVEIPIGYGRSNTLITVDLASGEPHALIAGETGSGKSTEMRSIITSVVINDRADMYLIDLKRGVEFNLFRKCKNVLGFARTEAEATALLQGILDEVDRRYDLMFNADCTDIKEYNKISKEKLRYQVLIIDEFAAFEGKKCFGLISLIAAQARACGIHLIISTQRPSADIIKGNIKANITNIVGLKTKDDVNSRVVIGSSGLEKLRGQGHGILKRGLSETVFQGPYLSPSEAKRLIAPFEVHKKEAVKKSESEIVDFEFMDVI